LVLDDNVELLRLATLMLHRLECEVICAETSVEAVTHFTRLHDRGTPFDLVILDAQIPGGPGGVDTLKKLQAISPDVAAILSTGCVTEEVASAFASTGFRAFLPKPYEIGKLAEVLERCGVRKVGNL
jgi:CheY-like chemotaxis protein